MAKFKKRKFYTDGNKQTIAAPVTIAEAVIVKSKSENTEEVTLKDKIKEFEDKNIELNNKDTELDNKIVELNNKDTELDNKDAALTEDITKITQNITKIVNSDGGASAGTGSSATRGGAVGNGATVGNGFAGGYLAKAVNSDGNGIDAIQLGQGTNSTEKTLQVYGDNIYDANTHTLNVQNVKKNGVNLLTVNDSADSLKCYDTRSVNSPPSYYYDMEKGIITEFKYASTLGITNANNTYVQLVTYRPWADPSGGAIYQTAYCNNQVLYRNSTSTTAWGEWYNYNEVPVANSNNLINVTVGLINCTATIKNATTRCYLTKGANGCITINGRYILENFSRVAGSCGLTLTLSLPYNFSSFEIVGRAIGFQTSNYTETASVSSINNMSVFTVDGSKNLWLIFTETYANPASGTYQIILPQTTIRIR